MGIPAVVLVLTTTSSLKNARKIADTLLKLRLSACVSVSPGWESHYEWESKRCASREFLVLIKTRKSLFPALRKAILKVHAYKVPEMVALPVTAGHKPYLDWVTAQTK